MPRVVEASHGRIAAAARTAVHDQRGRAVRIAALGIVEVMTVTGIDAAFAVWVDGCIECVTLTNGHVSEVSAFLKYVGGLPRRRNRILYRASLIFLPALKPHLPIIENFAARDANISHQLEHGAKGQASSTSR